MKTLTKAASVFVAVVISGCSSYSKVSEKNQVRFDSVEAAEKAGYKLAGNCSPNKNTRQ